MKALIAIIIIVISLLFTINSFAQPAWNYTVTSTSHTLVVQSASLNGSPLTAGDYIGVFFSDAGNLFCGGYMLWTGSSGAFTAYGDDPSTGDKEGFNENETLIWQVWQQFNNQIVSMTPILSIGSNSFGNNAMSVISSLNGETVALPIQISAVTTDLTCASNCNGSINLSVTGGTPPFSFEWSNGAATQNVVSLCAGSYQVIVTDYMGTMDSLDIQVNSPSEIIATATLSNYNGFAVSLPGLSDGSIQLSVSGGVSPYAYAWSNSSTNTTLIGLSASKYIVTITDFNGCSSVNGYTLNEPETQIIAMKSGWGIFSTYLAPINANIANVLSPLGTNLKIAKSGNGQIYWPQYGVNLIGNMNPGYGYQYQLYLADTIEVLGAIINPVETPIVLQANWNLLGYLHQFPLDIPFLLSDIAANLVIMKNEIGQVYWPQYNVNLIGNLQPGKGYQIKVNQADTLNYSEETLNYFIDDRDNNKYKIVTIGNQVWMAENLKYLPSVVGPGTGSETVSYYYVYDYFGTNVSEAKATANYSTYGVLYNWPAAMAGSTSSNSNPSGVQGVCPSGWHLPSDSEWVELEGYLGGYEVAGGKMKEIGLSHWYSPNTGATNESGFTGLPGGYRDGHGVFYSIGNYGHLWSSTENDANYALNRDLNYYLSNVFNNSNLKFNGFSVRCVRDESIITFSIGLQATPASGGIAIGAGQYYEGQIVNISAIPDSGYVFVHWTGDIAYLTHPDSLTTSLTMPPQNVNLTAVFTEGGTFTDSRDGNQYNYVTIGNQVWMAENLKYLPSVVGPGTGSYTDPYYYVYDYDGTNVSEAKATANYSTYGVLYNWPAAMVGSASSNNNPSGVQGVCPSGWHLPSDAEWAELEGYLGGYEVAGGKMKEIGLSHWSSPNTGATNESGFTGLPGGIRYGNGTFSNIGHLGVWWSSAEYYTGSAWGRELHFNYSHVARGDNGKDYGFSVRCVRDESIITFSIGLQATPASGGIAIGAGQYYEGQIVNISAIPDSGYVFDHWAGDTAYLTHPDSLTTSLTMPAQNVNLTAVFTESGTLNGTFTDSRDGNQYNYITIGNQVWMAENLKYLPSVVGPGVGSETVPYYYVYDYNGTNVSAAKATANYSTYGVLYNWPAAMAVSMSSNSNPSGVQGVCPSGWHLPSDVEWAELEGYLGGYEVAGGKIKEIGLSHWYSPNEGATNESGFTGLPGGYRGYDGTFSYIGSNGYWWSSTELNTYYAWNRLLSYTTSNVSSYYDNKYNGFSVRCLRD